MLYAHHSYGGPAADSALALTGHHGLKVGRAEHTTVSQVVGSRGCKREKPQISVHGDRQTWWTNRQELEERRGLFHYLLSHWSVSNCCTTSSLPLQAPTPAPGHRGCCVLFAAQCVELNVLNFEQHWWCTAQSPEAGVKISASQWSNRELSWLCH